MSTEAWKFEKDLCRCCHGEGTYKSVYGRCSSPDVQEMANKGFVAVVFSDMLRECFDIELAPVTGPSYSTVCKICDSCIVRLRDATKFKRQVRECERRFREQYQWHVGKVSEYEVEVKVEVPELESNEYDNVQRNYPRNEERNDFGGSILGHDGRKADNGFERKNFIEFKVKNEDTKPKQRVKLTNAKVSIAKVRNKTADLPSKVTKKGKTTVSKITMKKTVVPSSKVKKKVKLNISKATAKNTAARSSVTPNNNVAVDVCNVDQPSPVKLIRGIDYKRVGDKRQCCRCEYTCISLQGIKSHVKKIHLEIPQFGCSLCPKKFRTLSPFLKHKLDEHNIDDKLKCHACDRSFNTKDHMRKHTNSFHMLGKKYKCDVCDYESYSARSTSRHKRVHDNERNFHCKYCRKAFKRKTNLQCHERIHTGDKRQVCKECGQAFVQKASLNYHMMKYHPDVNF